MEYRILNIYTNYIDAHIVKGRLEAEGIQCWLNDEHLSGMLVDPILTRAIVGIKLLVPEDQFDNATRILSEPPSDNMNTGNE